MALLEARGLEKWYGRRQVVNGVDFEVNQGEVVGLLGPNGAGKTTSFRMTIGLIDADGGNVVFDGRDVTRLPMYQRARSGMGYLAQDSSVFKQLSVEDNLMAILETRRQHEPPPAQGPAERAARPVRPDAHPQDQGQPRLGRRAATAGDRPLAGHRAQADHARRAVRGHRPQDGQRDPGPDPRPRRRVQPRHPPDRPQLPRDDRGHRPQLPDPRGAGLRLGHARARSCSTPTSAATTSASGSTPATCSSRSSAGASSTTATGRTTRT